MKTKFTPIVKFKKSELDKREERVQNLILQLRNQESRLKSEIDLLMHINQPTSGTITEYKSIQLLIHRQREIINEAIQRVEELKEALLLAKKRQQEAYVEFEKYKYLESEEVKKMLKKIKLKETKDLDEVALQAFMNKRLSHV